MVGEEGMSHPHPLFFVQNVSDALFVGAGMQFSNSSGGLVPANAFWVSVYEVEPEHVLQIVILNCLRFVSFLASLSYLFLLDVLLDVLF